MAPLSANDVVDIRKALATAVTANRTDEIKRHLLRLRQELVASEELLRVRSARSFCCMVACMLIVERCTGHKDWAERGQVEAVR